MKKLKLILPFAALATVPAIVMPLTACNKINDYSFVIEGDEMEEWTPYPQTYKQEHPDGIVKVQHAMKDYINEFDNISEGVARDVVYNIIHEHQGEHKTLKRIEIHDCFFDTYEWRLSNKVKSTSLLGAVIELTISKLPYTVDPSAHTTNKVYFSPVGFGGSILQDEAWSIEYKIGTSDKVRIDHNTSLADWNHFWITLGHDYLCFIPYYYNGCTIDIDNTQKR